MRLPWGFILAGFNNPVVYLFNYELAEREGLLQVTYRSNQPEP
jgi:hypothetical protein